MHFRIRSVYSLAVLLFVFCLGCGTPSFLVTPVSSSNKLDEDQVQPGKGWAPGKVAIVEVEGMLANVKSGGLLQPTENTVSKFVQELEEAEKDDSVKAVVLRVNSPGGTVTSSDTMYTVLQRFKEKTHKPVGSIGVIFETMQFKGTLDKLGVTTAAIKSGSLKDMGSPFRAMKDDERVVMKEMVEEYFSRFVHIVSDHRPVTEKPVDDLTTYEKDGYAGLYSGRVFSGERAVQLGLADQTGQLTDAIDLARKLANVPNASAIMYRRPYGYGGSIYASSSTPEPQANVMKLELPESKVFLPGGFYYLWEP